MSRLYTKKIKKCYECPHWDHSGAFTPGGAKNLCGHPKNHNKNWPDDEARDRREKENHPVEGKNYYRVIPGKSIPVWCKLPKDNP